jgi:hypothetical protein
MSQTIRFSNRGASTRLHCFLTLLTLAIFSFFLGTASAQEGKVEAEPKTAETEAADEGESEQADAEQENDEPKFNFLKIGQQAPAIDAEHWLTDNNGLLPEFNEFEKGNVYVLHFFLTDNDYTTSLLPSLVKLQSKFVGQKLHVIAVSVEGQDAVESFMDGDLSKSVKKDDEFKSLETQFDLVANISTIADPDRSIWNDYQEQSGRTSFSAFIIGRKGEIEWIGSPDEIEKPLTQVVQGTWDRKAVAEALAAEQKKNIDKMMAATRFAKWQQEQVEGREELDLEGLKEMLADGFADPKNESFKVLIQRARLEIMKLSMDSKLAEVMTSFTDLVDDPAEGTTLNNIAWEIYELYEAGRVDKKSKEMIAAKYMAEKAVKLDPDSGAINDTIAHFVYLIDGDIDKAIEYQKKAIANAEGGRTEDLQPFLDFLLKEKKTGKKKSLQKNPKKEKDDDADF